MKRPILAAALAGLLALAGAHAMADGPRVPFLDAKSEATLSGEALVFYELAKEYNDRVNHDAAVLALAEAARLAPDNVPLQYLTGRRARERALAYYRGSFYSQYHLDKYPPPNAPLAQKHREEAEAIELAHAQGKITDEELARERARLKIQRPDYASPPWRTSDPFLDIARECVQRLMTSDGLTEEQQIRLRNDSLLLERAQTLAEERDNKRLQSGLPLMLTINSQRRRALALDAEDELDPGDPASFFIKEERDRRRQERDSVLAATTVTEKERPGFVNPYAPIPGEFIVPALPTPTPPPPPGQPGQPGFDGFGPVGGDPAFGAPADPTDNVFGAGK